MILVTGSVRVAADSLDEALRLSLEHVRRSRLEAGCRMHSVQVDVEDAHRLVFHEIWDDAASLRAHFDLPESGRFVTALTALATSSPEMQVYDATPVRV
ncbi:MAG: putative quinol monooxygenase [Mycobacteriales bacterium]|nr:putative quinol monooxygenase [Mycobacteriales bacterium]